MPLEEYDANDGKALGHDLLWRASSSKKRVERLTEMFKKSRGLRELILEQPWLKAMMATAVRGHLNMNKAVGTKLECVDEAEVRDEKDLMRRVAVLCNLTKRMSRQLRLARILPRRSGQRSLRQPV